MVTKQANPRDGKMINVHQSLTGTIGTTPNVRLNRIADGTGADIIAKLELQNPLGSVKDRK